MNSILTSVKKLLGIAEECTDFDADIIMYINMADKLWSPKLRFQSKRASK